MKTHPNSALIALRRIAVLLLLSLAVSACGEDDTIAEVRAGDFEYFPGSVNFSNVAIGDSITDFVTITNRGEQTVELNNLQLRDGPNGDASAFSIVNPWEGTHLLVGDSSITVEVEYAPTEAVRYSGVLSFETNVPGDDALVEIGVSAATPRPDLFTNPESIVFTRTAPDTSDTQFLEIQNIGHASLEIESITISGDVEFTLSFPTYSNDGTINPPDQDSQSAPSSIAPGDSATARVTFAAVDDDFRSAIISIRSNDPSNAVYPVVVSANSNAPCLEINNSEVNFGLSSIGNTTRQQVQLTNCSDVAETVITGISLSDDADGVFLLDENFLPGHLAEGGNAVLGPFETVDFQIRYSPNAEQVDEGLLEITSNDAARANLEIPVLGEGSNFECPVAVAEARISGTTRWDSNFIQAVPLDYIEFSSENSHDPEETALSYEWTILDRPLGSNTFFEPSPTSASPSMLVDIAGAYVVELSVFSEYGIASCEPVQLRIEAAPSSDIHVELTWSVPSSPSGTGTDIDLHYIHENGSFGQKYRGSGSVNNWEVFWQNSGPLVWNESNEESVSLDIDDFTGARPENINHINPTPGSTYSVGVYYYHDYEMGASDATIRVFLAGNFVREITRRLENSGQDSGTGDFWHALDIPWDGISLDVVDIDILHNGVPDP